MSQKRPYCKVFYFNTKIKKNLSKVYLNMCDEIGEDTKFLNLYDD